MVKRTWMVGVDGSDGAASALRWAITAATARGDRVQPVATWAVALPVWARSGMRAIHVDRDAYRASVESSVVELVDRVQASMGLAGESVIEPPDLVEGHPADVLTDRAAPARPWSSAVAGSDRSADEFLGSVSQYATTHARGPVVVVPTEWDRPSPTRIVVGYDASSHADAALSWALSFAPADASVTALTAVDAIPWLTPDVVEQRAADVVAERRAEISAAADRVDPEGRAHREVVLHSPRQALAEALTDADLVVVGPRGRSGLARTVLGSTTTWLLHDAGCPVAVIPSR